MNIDSKVLLDLSNLKITPKITKISTKAIKNGYFCHKNKVFYSKNNKNKFLFDIKNCKLFGNHNLSNILIATAICKKLGVKNNDIQKAITEFVPLKHRLQFVKNVNGVEYYNDSKSTSPDSTITAINSFSKKPIILLLGGSDKNTKFDKLAKKIAKSTVKFVVLSGYTAKQIGCSLKKAGFKNYITAKSFDEAVMLATQIAKVGDVVLLSPACASFDYFKNYCERGEQFEKLVQSIKTNQT